MFAKLLTIRKLNGWALLVTNFLDRLSFLLLTDTIKHGTRDDQPKITNRVTYKSLVWHASPRSLASHTPNRAISVTHAALPPIQREKCFLRVLGFSGPLVSGFFFFFSFFSFWQALHQYPRNKIKMKKIFIFIPRKLIGIILSCGRWTQQMKHQSWERGTM